MCMCEQSDNELKNNQTVSSKETKAFTLKLQPRVTHLTCFYVFIETNSCDFTSRSSVSNHTKQGSAPVIADLMS